MAFWSVYFYSLLTQVSIEQKMNLKDNEKLLQQGLFRYFEDNTKVKERRSFRHFEIIIKTERRPFWFHNKRLPQKEGWSESEFHYRMKLFEIQFPCFFWNLLYSLFGFPDIIIEIFSFSFFQFSLLATCHLSPMRSLMIFGGVISSSRELTDSQIRWVIETALKKLYSWENSKHCNWSRLGTSNKISLSIKEKNTTLFRFILGLKNHFIFSNKI